MKTERHSTRKRTAHRPMRGFTLIELAIVLFIITLLLGGVLTPLGQQITERQTGETRRAMESARIALVGYALRQANQAGPLPCPDVRSTDARHAEVGNPDGRANDGLEDRLPDGKCAVLTGNLPWKTLGLAEGDAWGNRLGYAVAADWTQPGKRTSSAGSLLQICPNKACGQPMSAAALVLSHGRNGFGADNLGGSRNLTPTSADEAENNNEDARFVMHPPRAADRPGGEFDDLLLPLSPDWLRGRLCDPASLCAGG
jgi:prepilin-type N-terminal cleavage/methylation domain-containing protein